MARKKITNREELTEEAIEQPIKPPLTYIRIPVPSFKSRFAPLYVIALMLLTFTLGAFLMNVYSQTRNSAQAANNQISPSGIQQNPQAAAQAPAGKIKDVSDSDHILGNKNAKVTLVEYSDFECPFCKSFVPTLQQLMQTYGDKIRLVYRHFPLSFHQNAQKEAEASECVTSLGGNDAFWKFHDKIFERTTSNGTGFALAQLGPLAAEVGVDQTQFQNCLDSGKYTQLVKDEEADGTTGGVSGTPSTFVVDANGKTQLVVGAQPINAFKTAIDPLVQ